jgi:hypothetical protein
MSAIIHDFSGITRLDLDPDRVLEQAKGQLGGVVVLGFDHDGQFYGASSYADGGAVMWLLEACKHQLLQSGATCR